MIKANKVSRNKGSPKVERVCDFLNHCALPKHWSTPLGARAQQRWLHFWDSID